MRFLAAVWNIYLGLLTLLGHGLLVVIGIALCAYATMQQLHELHDTKLDCLLFAVGILLVAFSTIRRLFWTFLGLALGWGLLVAAGVRVLRPHEHFSLTSTLIAVAAVPPLLLALLLEFTRSAPEEITDLEITLSEPTDTES